MENKIWMKKIKKSQLFGPGEETISPGAWPEKPRISFKERRRKSFKDIHLKNFILMSYLQKLNKTLKKPLFVCQVYLEFTV